MNVRECMQPPYQADVKPGTGTRSGSGRRTAVIVEHADDKGLYPDLTVIRLSGSDGSGALPWVWGTVQDLFAKGYDHVIVAVRPAEGDDQGDLDDPIETDRKLERLVTQLREHGFDQSDVSVELVNT